MNITLVPAQIVLPAALDKMLTLAGRFGFTVIVIVFDVAGEPVAQVAFDVMMTLTMSPLFNVVVVNVVLFVPAFAPFTCHW